MSQQAGINSNSGPEDSACYSPQDMPAPSLTASDQSHYHYVLGGPGMLVAPLGELREPGDPGRLHVEAWVPSSLPDLRRYKERDSNALQPLRPTAALTGDTSGAAPRPVGPIFQAH